MKPPQFGNINNYLSDLSANYNSVQIVFNKRYSKGFTLLGSYTFSKALGIGSASAGGEARVDRFSGSALADMVGGLGAASSGRVAHRGACIIPDMAACQ